MRRRAAGAQRAVGQEAREQGEKMGRAMGRGARTEDEGDQLARPHAALVHELRAVVEHEARAAVRQKGEGESRIAKIGSRLLVHERAVASHVATVRARHLLLGGEGADGAHGAKRLLGDGRRVRERLLVVLGQLADEGAEDARGDDNRRHADECDEAEPPVDRHHRRRGQHDLEERADEDVDVELDLVAHLLAVRTQPAADLARLGLVEKAELSREQALQQPLPQPRREPRAEHGERGAAHACGEAGDGGGEHELEHRLAERRWVGRERDVVEDLAVQVRDHTLARGRHRQPRERLDEERPVGRAEREHVGHPRAPRRRAVARRTVRASRPKRRVKPMAAERRVLEQAERERAADGRPEERLGRAERGVGGRADDQAHKALGQNVERLRAQPRTAREQHTTHRDARARIGWRQCSRARRALGGGCLVGDRIEQRRGKRRKPAGHRASSRAPAPERRDQHDQHQAARKCERGKVAHRVGECKGATPQAQRRWRVRVRRDER